ncbi:MAG TPA: hypothetical protein VJA26_05415 [Gammaproteobacteria bacterium]|nr:hypothetical protein [Gammaproteobacteria bacterium]
MAKHSEAEVAAVVMDHMLADGYDCYPEVECAEGRADIVGVRPFPFMPQRKCVHIVECKTSWSLDLLEQAVRRKGYAHYVSIAAPTMPNPYFEVLCRREGIGMLRFEPAVLKYRGERVTEEYRSCLPRLNRHRPERYYGPASVLDLLDEDHKRYAPGTTSDKGYSTAWRRTMDRAAAYVREHPGCTAREIVEKVEHHYSKDSGARQGMLLWLSKRSDVESRHESGALRFYQPGVPSRFPELLREREEVQ